MVNVIGQVQELESVTKEWKEYNDAMQLKVGYDDLELLSSSDIDTDESDDEDAHFHNDVHQKEPKWMKFSNTIYGGMPRLVCDMVLLMKFLLNNKNVSQK